MSFFVLFDENLLFFVLVQFVLSQGRRIYTTTIWWRPLITFINVLYKKVFPLPLGQWFDLMSGYHSKECLYIYIDWHYYLHNSIWTNRLELFLLMQLFHQAWSSCRQQNKLVVILEDVLKVELLNVIGHAYLIEVFYALLQMHWHILHLKMLWLRLCSLGSFHQATSHGTQYLHNRVLCIHTWIGISHF